MMDKGLIINSDDNIETDKIKFDKEQILRAIQETCSANNKLFVFKDMPVRLNEIVLSDPITKHHITRNWEYSVGNEYLKSYIDLNRIALVYWDMISTIKYAENKNAFASRVAYDKFINYGLFKIKEKQDPLTFLTDNKIFTSNDLNYRLLAEQRENLATIFNLGKREEQIIDIKKLIHAEGNALLLFFTSNKMIDVINC
jgi:hypothetical protein